MIAREFISELIEVEGEGTPLKPKSFKWRGAEYRVKDVIELRHDYGFGALPAHARTWRTRRHRTWFTVVTEESEIFTLYIERGSGRRVWYLYSRDKI